MLWIDDDPLLLGLCVGVLEKHGYRVLTAPDGAQGIAVAHAARPDVILLDVLMPTMNGIEVCRQLRTDATLHDTPIILLTGSATFDTVTFQHGGHRQRHGGHRHGAARGRPARGRRRSEAPATPSR